MRIQPINSLADLENAIASAERDVASRWYVARVAQAMGATDKIPAAWAGSVSPVTSFREYPESEQEAVSEQLSAIAAEVENYSNKRVGLEDLEDAALAASIAAGALRNQFESGLVASLNAFVQYDRLTGDDAEAIVAAAKKPRKVRTQAGVRRFNQPIGTVILPGGKVLRPGDDGYDAANKAAGGDTGSTTSQAKARISSNSSTRNLADISDSDLESYIETAKRNLDAAVSGGPTGKSDSVQVKEYRDRVVKAQTEMHSRKNGKKSSSPADSSPSSTSSSKVSSQTAAVKNLAKKYGMTETTARANMNSHTSSLKSSITTVDEIISQINDDLKTATGAKKTDLEADLDRRQKQSAALKEIISERESGNVDYMRTQDVPVDKLSDERLATAREQAAGRAKVAKRPSWKRDALADVKKYDAEIERRKGSSASDETGTGADRTATKSAADLVKKIGLENLPVEKIEYDGVSVDAKKMATHISLEGGQIGPDAAKALTSWLKKHESNSKSSESTSTGADRRSSGTQVNDEIMEVIDNSPITRSGDKFKVKIDVAGDAETPDEAAAAMAKEAGVSYKSVGTSTGPGRGLPEMEFEGDAKSLGKLLGEYAGYDTDESLAAEIGKQIESKAATDRRTSTRPVTVSESTSDWQEPENIPAMKRDAKATGLDFSINDDGKSFSISGPEDKVLRFYGKHIGDSEALKESGLMKYDDAKDSRRADLAARASALGGKTLTHGRLNQRIRTVEKHLNGVQERIKARKDRGLNPTKAQLRDLKDLQDQMTELKARKTSAGSSDSDSPSPSVAPRSAATPASSAITPSGRQTRDKQALQDIAGLVEKMTTDFSRVDVRVLNKYINAEDGSIDPNLKAAAKRAKIAYDNKKKSMRARRSLEDKKVDIRNYNEARDHAKKLIKDTNLSGGDSGKA